jgi:endonuclease/exonuclease/phosphatase family metal-dependent hydrolase
MTRARERLVVVTYNLWHGLNPDHPLRFQEHETGADREARLRCFLRFAREARPDLLFLQEVNPAPALTRRIARELGYDAHFALDNAGLKIGPLGVPTNLRSGLTILAAKDLRLRPRGACKLSGPPGFAHRWLSLQAREFRYAVAAEATIDGRRWLLLGTHLHHGPEADADIRAAVDGLAAAGKITADRAQEVLAAFARGSARRRGELEKALAFARRLAPPETPTLFAGDFNASPDAPELQWLQRERGFRSATDDDPARRLLTWDYERNPNIKFFADFEPVTAFEPVVMNAVQPVIARQTRRLDYIFYRNMDGLFAPAATRLFADQPCDGVFGSDHFGVYAEFRGSL